MGRYWFRDKTLQSLSVPMSRNSEIRKRAEKVLSAVTDNFVELVKISGLNPSKDFVGANLRGVDFGGSDLSEFRFRNADLRGAILHNATYNASSFTGAIVDQKTVFNMIAVPMDVFVAVPNGYDPSINVSIFTPAGDRVVLPMGSSFIDFAYAIHTEIGNEIVGAEVDGIKRPIWARVSDGETVKILTSFGSKPSEEWLDHVETKSAYQKIRSALSKASASSLLTEWRGTFKSKFPELADDDRAVEQFSNLAYRALQGLPFEKVQGKRFRMHVFCSIILGLVSESKTGTVAAPISGLPLRTQLQLCPTCMPVVGERIVGILGSGFVEVHSIACDVLERFEKKPGVWLDLAWSDSAKGLKKALAEFEERSEKVISRVRQSAGRRIRREMKFTRTKEKPK